MKKNQKGKKSKNTDESEAIPAKIDAVPAEDAEKNNPVEKKKKTKKKWKKRRQ